MSQAVSHPPAADRERAILDLLRRHLAGLAVDPRPRVTLAVMHKGYLWVAGYREAYARAGLWSIDESRRGEGLVGVTRWHRTRGQLNRDLRALGERPDHPFWSEVGETLPGDATSRSTDPDATAAAKALAVYFLTRAGGGRLSVLQAAMLVQAQTGEEPLDGADYHRMIRTLRRQLGPLTPEANSTQ